MSEVGRLWNKSLRDIINATPTDLVGVDLAPEAVVFCRKTHRRAARFEVGDVEHLPFDDVAFDVVTNFESSHTYPNLRAFFAEVRRVLVSGGRAARLQGGDRPVYHPQCACFLRRRSCHTSESLRRSQRHD